MTTSYKQDYPNSGTLRVNDRKETDKHPDRTGDGSLTCPQCAHTWRTWINGWLKKDKEGQPFLSLAFKPKVRKDAP